MMTLDRHVIGALVRHQQLVPGALGTAFYDIPPDPAYIQQVAQWHQSQPANAKLSPEGVKILSAPDLVADIRSLTGRDSILRTWALSRADCQPGPLLLLAPTGENRKQLKIETVANREMLADTMLLWLVGEGEPSEPEMKVEMTHAEFAVLLAFIDLYSRAKFSSYIAHRAMETAFSHAFVLQAYEEGIKSSDPRWLLGFAQHLLDDAALALDGNGVWQAMQGLMQRRLIEPQEQEFRFTLPGEYLAESLHRRTVSLAVDTVAAEGQGGLGTHATMLVRSDEPLWFFDLPPGGKITVCGASVQAAREVLDAVLTPAGRAPAARPPSAQSPAPPATPPYPQQAGAGYPQQAQPPLQARPQAPPAQGILQCRICGQRLAPGTVFCGNCGSRLS